MYTFIFVEGVAGGCHGVELWRRRSHYGDEFFKSALLSTSPSARSGTLELSSGSFSSHIALNVISTVCLQLYLRLDSLSAPSKPATSSTPKTWIPRRCSTWLAMKRLVLPRVPVQNLVAETALGRKISSGRKGGAMPQDPLGHANRPGSWALPRSSCQHPHRLHYGHSPIKQVQICAGMH